MSADGEPRADDHQPPHRVDQTRHQHDHAGKSVGDRQRQRRRSPNDFYTLIQEQDDAKGRDHLFEVVAVIEMPEHRELEQQPEGERGRQREDQREQEVAGQSVEHYREVGAQHVLDAVREVDEVHHAEHQRETRRDQEQQDAELKPVENLDDKEAGGHRTGSGPPLTSSGSPWHRDRSSW